MLYDIMLYHITDYIIFWKKWYFVFTKQTKATF